MSLVDANVGIFGITCLGGGLSCHNDGMGEAGPLSIPRPKPDLAKHVTHLVDLLRGEGSVYLLVPPGGGGGPGGPCQPRCADNARHVLLSCVVFH